MLFAPPPSRASRIATVEPPPPLPPVEEARTPTPAQTPAEQRQTIIRDFLRRAMHGLSKGKSISLSVALIRLFRGPWIIQVNINFSLNMINRVGGVMVSVLASSVVDRGFEPWSGQTKDYKIDSLLLLR